jgi:hypothetical protein
MLIFRTSGQGFFVAEDAPHRGWRRVLQPAFGRPVPRALSRAFLERKNKVRAPSSQTHREWLNLLQLHCLSVPNVISATSAAPTTTPAGRLTAPFMIIRLAGIWYTSSRSIPRRRRGELAARPRRLDGLRGERVRARAQRILLRRAIPSRARCMREWTVLAVG